MMNWDKILYESYLQHSDHFYRILSEVNTLKTKNNIDDKSQVVEVSKKFPEIRSAINIKYEQSMIVKANKKGMKVISYDRKKESKNSKQKENSSISWGISSCLESIKPDIIFHKGDMGKEPMIIVFGINPEQVIKKILSIQ